MKQLHAIVARACRLESRIVIPAFSLGRTQRMIYCFQELFQQHRVKPIPVFVDSPLAIRLTDVHREFPEAYTPESRRLMESNGRLFESDAIHFCMSFDESRRINSLAGPLVVIASSGMCEAGRIKHHLRHTVEDPDNAVVIVSYQAEGTLGRQISEGAERIRIMDEWYDLNAEVYVLDGFSGHADRADLTWWYEQTGGGIESAFLVHGDPEALEALAPVLQPQVRNPVVIPELAASYEV
jgi:metallo-beta-lactamase family protein